MAKTEILSPGNESGSKIATTFVQADSTCFRDLVQRLTGPSGTQGPIPKPPKPSQKLHERRKYNKPKIEISKPDIGSQAQQPNVLTSPSMWSPSSSAMVWSPHPSPISTPMAMANGSSNKRTSPLEVLELELNPGEEEKAIKEKRFYLHPSPRSKPRLAPEPELLTLFPLESPTTSSDRVKPLTFTLE